ncbi:retropepsin-like aspartic protease family protein [Rhizorhapis sp. SPR117]|uniref:retropepsin-like aspartic protease family protein n=1 Tax=Rhizorhapis sp. SPR117 TaxID=2912611 RepID=UPI001F022076|nr:TIGR02281 family clan AA aspartic protease [Rhizorhapis sp. SPR117]
MTGPQSAELIWLLLAMVLVGSALLSRRWSLTGALGMVLWWIVIFAIALGLFSYRSQISSIVNHVKSEVTGEAQQRVEGDTLRIQKSPDGHFWVDGLVNGNSTRFLVDSGASITALSERAALAAGLNIDQSGFPMMLATANGSIEAHRSNIALLEIGPLRSSDLAIVISPAFGDVNVLGMNFLSQLKSWRVEGDEMILEPA